VTADLDAFIAGYGARAHVWGVVDCSLMLADWAVANGYPDPAGHLRGTYGTEAECRAVVEAAGGVLPLVRGCAAAIGLLPLKKPERGAIAVIGSRTRMHRQRGAIFDGRDWLIRVPEGVLGVKAAAVAIWRI